MTTQSGTFIGRPEFPRSNRYDQGWMLDNQMGPNALWLCEWLCESLPLTPGMRVLDLGCGRAMTSVFLAREYGARVWAADLWMSPDNNWKRLLEAKVGADVCPMRVEAHALPFAQGFFDAVVSVGWYMGLLNGTPAATDTLASHSGWTEETPYTGNRPAISWSAASAGSKTATAVAYSITSSATITGAFLSSVNTGTSGILYSAGNFTSSRTVASGDTLNVTPTMSV